jgi:hypothetical protein
LDSETLAKRDQAFFEANIDGDERGQAGSNAVAVIRTNQVTVS